MNTRIGYGKLPPSTFFEDRLFTVRVPYHLRYKLLPEQDIAHVHYSPNIEVALFRDVSGRHFLQGEEIELHGNHAFIIPPFCIHSSILNCGPGEVFVLQVSTEAYSPYLDIKQLLRESKKVLVARELKNSLFPYVHNCLKLLMNDKLDLMASTAIVLDILNCFTMPADSLERTPADQDRRETSELLRNIIIWSMSNIQHSVSIADVASIVGYSPNYFCAWFKRHTGISYVRYFNTLRINYSCSILLDGGSLARACDSIGLSNMSYYIQLFKKIRGVTPKQFLRGNAKMNS